MKWYSVPQDCLIGMGGWVVGRSSCFVHHASCVVRHGSWVQYLLILPLHITVVVNFLPTNGPWYNLIYNLFSKFPFYIDCQRINDFKNVLLTGVSDMTNCFCKACWQTRALQLLLTNNTRAFPLDPWPTTTCPQPTEPCRLDSLMYLSQ